MTAIPVEKDQNIRVSLYLFDAVASMGYEAKADLNLTLEYSDGFIIEAGNLKCTEKCVNGKYDDTIDLKNARTDTVKVSYNTCKLQ